MSPDRPRVAVVGGGLAGISCALSLADAGVSVDLIERRAHLGGATWSFERNGRMFDNGQHVYLRCCNAYRRFLERLGTAELAPLQARLDIPVLSPRPGAAPLVSRIARSGLPSPLHLASSLLGYRHLGISDRARLGRALGALQHASPNDPSLDEETFAAFLARNGQRPAAIERLWDLITLPTTNLRAAEVSAAVAVKVFRTGLIDEADAADIGWSTVPLAELHGSPAVRELERAGAQLRLRAHLDTVELDDGAARVRDVVVDGERIVADAVVLALPHEEVAETLPPGALGVGRDLAQLGHSPIIDVHVVYAEPVTSYAIAAGVGTPVQYVFDRTQAAGLGDGGGQCLAVSVSGADEEHGLRPEVLIERYTTALADLFPKARTTEIRDAVVSREHRATFRARPGTRSMRPGPVTPIANLFLAGAWTDTGWPATMEGAVRSGTRAAWHVRRALGERVRFHAEVAA